MKKHGVIVVISGSSGVGKDTIIDIITSCSSFVRFPGYTTRKPRHNEIDGIHYNFVDEESFMIFWQQDDLLDHFVVSDFHYGLPIKRLIRMLEYGQNIIIHLSVEGVSLLKQNIPDAITVFIMPPSQKEILRRLRNRGMTEEEIINRTNDDNTTLQTVCSYDLVVVNHDDEEQETADRIIWFISQIRRVARECI